MTERGKGQQLLGAALNEKRFGPGSLSVLAGKQKSGVSRLEEGMGDFSAS